MMNEIINNNMIYGSTTKIIMHISTTKTFYKG